MRFNIEHNTAQEHNELRIQCSCRTLCQINESDLPIHDAYDSTPSTVMCLSKWLWLTTASATALRSRPSPLNASKNSAPYISHRYSPSHLIADAVRFQPGEKKVLHVYLMEPSYHCIYCYRLPRTLTFQRKQSEPIQTLHVVVNL